MYHSVTFAESLTSESVNAGTLIGMNSWEDWHLIPASRPTMAFPQPALSFIDCPAGGSIDMTEYLAGRVTFADRSGQFQFIVDNDHENWITLYQRIKSFINGKRLYMCLTDDDPGYYYIGRFVLNSWASEATNSKIVIDYQVEPYKYAIRTHGVDPTLWDTFNFETDDDWDPLINLTVNGQMEFIIHGYDYPFTIAMTVIDLSAGNSITVSFRGFTKTVATTGEQVYIPIPVAQGRNSLIVSGNGVVNFKFGDGSL